MNDNLTILCGDAIDCLKTLPDCSVHACITSPPYYGLRVYAANLVSLKTSLSEAQRLHIIQELKGLDIRPYYGSALVNIYRKDQIPSHLHDFFEPTEIGAEKTPQEYVEKLVAVFREVRRVLREDGVCWLNLGDCYSVRHVGRRDHGVGSSTSRLGPKQDGIPGGTEIKADGNRLVPGFKPKDLLMVPARVAIALQNDGWYLRSDCPWISRNKMPESTKDRPTTTIEHIYMLTKSTKYYYDGEAVKVMAKPESAERYKYDFSGAPEGSIICPGDQQGQRTRPKGKKEFSNKRARRSSDWFFESWQGLLQDEEGDPLAFVVNPQPFKGAHFACFSPNLIRPCIQASTSEHGCCPECGTPFERVIEVAGDATQGSNLRQTITIGWKRACDCTTYDPVPCTVLDPFGGSGTTGQVALELGCRAILIELNAAYIPLIHQRCNV